MTKFDKGFTNFATMVSRLAGRPPVFTICCGLVVLWAISGPLFKFSDTWQLVINTSTTIVTFLMVFLIQNTQNRDNAALQAKLDELIRSSTAKNAFIGIEHLSDEELEAILTKVERNAARLRDEAHGRKVARGKTAGRRNPKVSPAVAKRSPPRRVRRGVG